MTNKTTIKDNFLELRTLAEQAGRIDLVNFVDTRIAQVEAKNAKRTNKPTKSASETAEVAEIILANMPTGERLTASAIQGMIPELAGKSNQRMTAALKVLVNTGFVENIHEKGKSLFIKA